MKISFNTSITKLMPKQISNSSVIINLGKTTQAIQFTFVGALILSNPAMAFLINNILSIIESLNIFTHIVILKLNFPANL